MVRQIFYCFYACVRTRVRVLECLCIKMFLFCCFFDFPYLCIVVLFYSGSYIVPPLVCEDRGWYFYIHKWEGVLK